MRGAGTRCSKENVLHVLGGVWHMDLQEECVFSLSSVCRMNRTAGTASVVTVN